MKYMDTNVEEHAQMIKLMIEATERHTPDAEQNALCKIYNVRKSNENVNGPRNRS